MAVVINGSGAITGMVSASSSDLSTSLNAKLTTPGAWTAYTPTLTAATTNPTLGSGATQQGTYMQIGKLVVARFILAFGSSGSAGSGAYWVNLPVNSNGATATYGSGSFYRGGTFGVVVFRPQDATKCLLLTSSNSITGYVTSGFPTGWGASGDSIDGFFMYEAA